MRKSTKFPDGFYEFIRDNSAGRTSKQLVPMVKEHFGVDVTDKQIHTFRKNHRIRSGLGGGIIPDQPSKRYPEPVFNYIMQHYKGTSPKDMAERLNALFDTDYTGTGLRAFYKNHHLKSGIDTRYKPGHENTVVYTEEVMRKIMEATKNTQFKKGCVPYNRMEIGTLWMKSDGYVWIKTGKGKDEWTQYHRYIWEKEYGPIPEGHVLIFLNNDHADVRLDNLRLVSKAECLEMTRKGLRYEDAELTNVSATYVHLLHEVREKEHKRKDKNE